MHPQATKSLNQELTRSPDAAMRKGFKDEACIHPAHATAAMVLQVPMKPDSKCKCVKCECEEEEKKRRRRRRRSRGGRGG